jgi:small subunit ribosomal protein S6
MRSYELAYIADPELDDSALSDLEEKVKGWISAAGGKPIKVDRWGKRRLAYPIRKRKDGYYVFITMDLPEQSGAELERGLRLDEAVMRFLITQQAAA